MLARLGVRALGIAVWGWALATTPGAAQDLLLADGAGWPGRILGSTSGATQALFVRSLEPGEGLVPRIQSLTVLPDGRTVFCSGLDRHLREWTPSGERPLQHGGYLARQVRTGDDGLLYWSGLETPRDGAPLPDGFIYSWNPASDEFRTVLTFSQEVVGRDWWGAFDVRGGRIYAGTLRDRTRIYDVTDSAPAPLVAELPISATAFRFAADGALWASDGQGQLYRFPDLARPGAFQVVLHSPEPFVDFAWPVSAAPTP